MMFVNVVTRSLIVLVGLGIAFSIEPFIFAPSPLQEIFGCVITLYGVYRLVILRKYRVPIEEIDE